MKRRSTFQEPPLTDAECGTATSAFVLAMLTLAALALGALFLMGLY